MYIALFLYAPLDPARHAASRTHNFIIANSDWIAWVDMKHKKCDSEWCRSKTGNVENSTYVTE